MVGRALEARDRARVQRVARARRAPSALFSARSIFKLGVWSFTGFAALFPVVVAALFWRRSTKQGALAAILSVALLWTYFFFQGWQTPGYTVGGTGLMPVAVILAVAALAMVVVSLLTRPPDAAVVGKFFDGAEAAEDN